MKWVKRLRTWWTGVTARHPRLYAHRHVAGAVSGVLLTIVGVTVFAKTVAGEVLHAVLGWLPDLRLPDIDFPDLPIPSIPFPDLPDITMPGWVGSITDVAKYVVPVLIALAMTQAEIKRRAAKDGRRDATDDNPKD
jgi:hypothetical protein